MAKKKAKPITRGVIFDDRGKGRYQSLYRGKKLLKTIRIGDSNWKWSKGVLKKK